ncbi:ORF6N domain-containing protein [Ligilactobacillus acidipiscis]|uniref:ORF6N domain-containing protein n=1 Tax=Ligilactobacillus acidipiscis TaxID=89059 RepID=UPI0022DEFBB5|nr:ORF6N domain-containing protein [Ligilactobacillus acidipiscis]
MNQIKVIGQEKVAGIKFTGIEGGFGKNKKAMLVKDIAKIHERPVKKINELINNNIKRFKEGIDLIDLKQVLQKDLFSEYGFTKAEWGNSNSIYLLSERGYSKLLKILEDDKAWEIYDKLVDGYFDMRVALKNNQPELVDEGKAERLAIMKSNSETRRASLMYRIAMATKSEIGKENLLARAAKELTGEMTLPVQKQKEYSANQVAEKIGHGLSGNMVGRIANKLGLKAEQPGQNKYGRWANSKSQHSDKEIPQWLYTDQGLKAIRKYQEENAK